MNIEPGKIMEDEGIEEFFRFLFFLLFSFNDLSEYVILDMSYHIHMNKELNFQQLTADTYIESATLNLQ